MAVEAHHLLPFSPQLLFVRELTKAANPQPPMVLSDPQTEFVVTTAAVCKKRPRDPLTFLLEDLSSHLHHEMLDLDRLLIDHNEIVRGELAEQRRCFTRQLAAAVEDSFCKRLKAKDDEIERVKRVNLAFEEQVRSLSMENQIWKELAHTNEATANLLRNNLEQVLTTQLHAKEEKQRIVEATIVDDAESCYYGESDDPITPAARPMRPCRRCGEKEAIVLLLPCRHLCFCVACGREINSCPICKCLRTGSVNVNLS